ncbi:hypothetical protein DPMN_075979 [Dreissena polymorpha]|uniref:Uncharacterized protein n=1 Tax=Dreissena polymorpha TaxID=45954 RepID=A0A9D4BN74_DREPO|nr:hypothetical protein DPMN_075979 [Dreissena polymorpha]
MYRCFTGTLAAFNGASPGRYRSSAGVYMGPGGATVPSRLFPVVPGATPVVAGPSRLLPVHPGGIKDVNTSPVEPRSFPVLPCGAPVHPGRAPVHPCRFRITHRGSAGIIGPVSL